MIFISNFIQNSVFFEPNNRVCNDKLFDQDILSSSQRL